MNNNLDNSLWICTNEKPHNCKVCNEELSQKDILNIHLYTHLGKKLQIREICNKGFSYIGNLKTHLRAYTGKNL